MVSPSFSERRRARLMLSRDQTLTRIYALSIGDRGPRRIFDAWAAVMQQTDAACALPSVELTPP
jgi:hypothetical protein